MISVDSNKGRIVCSGALDEILAEYTFLTTLLLGQMTDMSDKDKAFNALAKLGQIAVDDFTQNLEALVITERIDKVISDELQV